METGEYIGQYRWLHPIQQEDNGWVTHIHGLVCDVDDTVYTHQEYHAAGTRKEIAEIAVILERSFDDTQTLITMRRRELTSQLGRPAAMTETVLSLGVSRQQWNELRCRAWQPEQWFKRDPLLCDLFAQLNRRYRIAFGTNSPLEVGRCVLAAIGITETMSDVQVFGPESFSVSKPNVDFFRQIAKELGLNPALCVSIGDREANDGTPAIDAGFANALIITGRDALVAALSHFFIP